MNRRVEWVNDLEEEKKKKDREAERIYVDTEGRPWRKDSRGEFIRIPIERKP